MEGTDRTNSRSLGAYIAALVVSILYVLTLIALQASTAVAAPTCTGSSITGLGTTLQKSAQQEVWAPTFEAAICNKGTFPTVTYNLATSEAAMKEWNFDGTRGAINNAFPFIGTDSPPTAAQIAKIKSVA